MQFRRDRGARAIWRDGLFETQRLQAGADILFNSYLPRIPFGLVMVEVPKLRRQLVQTPEVRPHHLVASCSIPFLYPFVNIGGTHFTDGACLEPLPLWAAVAMGATEIVAIDCMQRVTPWWVHAAAASLRLISGARPIPKRLPVTMISPSKMLGSAMDAGVWKREKIESWLELGARDADRVMNASLLERTLLERTLSERTALAQSTMEVELALPDRPAAMGVVLE